MSFSRIWCLNVPDAFCYICGEYCLDENRKTSQILWSKLILRILESCLETKASLGLLIRVANAECLRHWTNRERKSLKFGVHMVWREQKNHHDDCYFCVVKVKGFNLYKKNKWEYPDLESARRPIPHSKLSSHTSVYRYHTAGHVVVRCGKILGFLKWEWQHCAD